MCKLTYIKLCSVYWSLASLMMLCCPEKSRNLEWNGKLVACVDYGGTLKGAVIFPFGYYPSIRLRKSRNFHLDRWQPTWNFRDFSLHKSRLLRLPDPGLSLFPQLLLFFVCLFVFILTISWTPQSLAISRGSSQSPYFKFFPSITHKLLTAYI
jgi:hypothetical protein